MGKFAKRSAGITVAVVALAGAGVAFAAWTSTGTGTGTATAGSASNLVITQTASATGLYPTGQVSAPFTVQNPNPYAVTLSGATASNFSVDSGHSGCNVASVSASPITLSDVIPAGGTSSAHNMVVQMANSANDACQGATFTFTITVNGASS